jgi:hypothetical protein
VTFRESPEEMPSASSGHPLQSVANVKLELPRAAQRIPFCELAAGRTFNMLAGHFNEEQAW